MRFSVYVILAIVISTLSGCKLTAEVSVNMTELLARTDKELKGDLYVEVPSCDVYSDEFKRVRNDVPKLLGGTEYIGCSKKKLDYLIHFKIPIHLRRNTEYMDMGESSNINLIFDDKNELTIGLPRSLRKDIAQMVWKDMSIISSMFSSVPKFKITLKNDTGRNFGFIGIASYVGESPYTYTEARSIAGNSFVVTLSDVSIKRAMKYGLTTFFKKLD